MKITKQTLIKSFKTFLQAAIAYVCVNISSFNYEEQEGARKAALMTFAVSSVAAGICAVMNIETKESEEIE